MPSFGVRPPPRRIRPAGPPGWSLVEAPPAAEHRATVFWLHGLGADGTDFLPILPALGLLDDLGIRFVFPEAPPRPVTLNGGMIMPAWYDIRDLSREGHADREELQAAATGLSALIRAERKRGIPPERIVLAGFSQGGVVALHTALTRQRGESEPPRVAGVLGMSCYLAFPEAVTPAGAGSPPVMLAHGTEDEMIDISLGRRARDTLGDAGWNVDFRTYFMGHHVSDAEVRDVRGFLRRVLEASGSLEVGG